MSGLTCDIRQYQHPDRARVQELEAELRRVLAAQLDAECEIARLQRLAAEMADDIRDLKRSVLMTKPAAPGGEEVK